MARVKYILTIFLLVVFTSMCLASEVKKKQQFFVEEEDFKQIEVAFLLIPCIPQFDFRNSVSDSYSEYWYDSYWYDSSYVYTDYFLTAGFSSSIAGESEMGYGFGGLFNCFFHRNFGFQFMLERSRNDVPVKASHGVDMSINYWWGSVDYSEEPYIYDTTGSLTIIPISFNGIARFDGVKNISGYVSGGLTYYKVDIEAKSKLGYGFPFLVYDYPLWYLRYDSFLVPISIDDSISGAGVNVGGGVVFKIQENVGIVGDFRYYLAPPKIVSWTLTSGEYTLSIYEEYSMRFTQVDIGSFLKEYGELIKVEVNPSFFRIAFGLQFRF